MTRGLCTNVVWILAVAQLVSGKPGADGGVQAWSETVKKSVKSDYFTGDRATDQLSDSKSTPDCYANISLSGPGQGVIHSPYYPEDYPNDLDCHYYIHTAPGFLTQLNFDDFDLEYVLDCKYDYLQVFADTMSQVPLSDKHCGKVPPMLDLISAPSISIHFHSDFSQAGAGFSLFYRVFRPGDLCMFGSEEGCAFACHCDNDALCDRESCNCKSEAAQGAFVGDQWSGPGCQTGNIAYQRSANQSGTGLAPDGSLMPAELATDGYKDLGEWGRHCAWVVSPTPDIPAWWIVDLGDLYQVFRVTLFNTGSFNQSLTLGYFSLKHSRDVADIRLMQGCNGKTLPVEANSSFSMTCPVVARYVGLERNNNPSAVASDSMALCEVKVLGHKFYDVDCSVGGPCVGSCHPGLFCEQCEPGFRRPDCVEIEQEGASCGMPPAPQHGQVMYNDTWTGSVAVYECDLGFLLQGDRVVVCAADGEWSDIPTCPRVDCGVPPLDNSAESLDYVGTLYGDKVTYQCAPGYIMRGSPVLRCTQNGTWDQPPPKCEAMSCGAPPTVAHGVLSGVTGNIVDSVATYECEEGFQPSGSMEYVCGPDQEWVSRGEVPQCTEVPCKPPPPAPAHGYISYENGSLYNSVAEYKCEDSYFLAGVDGDCFTITCTATGKWSSRPPKCIQECGGLLTETFGEITTPNWPEAYDDSRKCSWLIKAPRPGDQISVTFMDFDLETSENCTYDHLNLFDSNGMARVKIGKYCGAKTPPVITTVGNFLLLEFLADAAEEGRGFRARYSIVKADGMGAVRVALATFYPGLMTRTMVQSDLHEIAEAVTYLQSFMLTVENAFQYAECLFVLQTEDGIQNVLFYHAVPRLKQYLYYTFDRAIYHIPRNYHTARVIMELIEGDNLTQVYDQLVAPLVAVQRVIQSIIGLSEYKSEPVLFSALEEPLLVKMVEHRDRSAAELVIFLVDFLHGLVLGDEKFLFKVEMLQCPPIEQAAASLLYALENATNSLSEVMGSLPAVIDSAFGPGARQIVSVYEDLLVSQFHILHHPFHILSSVRRLVLQTFALKQDIGEPLPDSTINSGLDVDKYLMSTQPLTAKWFSHSLEENLRLSQLNFIMVDVERTLLASVPHAANQSVEEVTLVAFELMARAFHQRVVEDMPGYCLDGKLTAMLVGFLEIHLIDIALSDLNMTTHARHIAHILQPGGMEHTEEEEEAINSISSKLKARLFNIFRARLLDIDRELEQVTGGPVSTETLPMDLAVIVASKKPRTMGALMREVVEVAIPVLMVNVSCNTLNWTSIDRIVVDFLDSFSDLSLEVTLTYESLVVNRTVDTEAGRRVIGAIQQALTAATDHLLYTFTQLHLVKGGVENKLALELFFSENLALSLYNVVQMVQPNAPPPAVSVSDLMEVIQWQHDGLQQLVLHYMEGLRRMLRLLKRKDFDPCMEYPDVCTLNLVDSLTTRRK